MPEIPDLEVYRENLIKLIVNKEISVVEIYENKNFNGNNYNLSFFANKKIIDIIRNGKELYFITDKYIIDIHLMLNGEMHFDTLINNSTLKNKIFEIKFKNGESLLISDYQKYCTVKIVDKIDFKVPDALSADFSLEYFIKIVSNSRKSIKVLLTDQKMIKGIGNAYADEILYFAKIHPESISNKIPLNSVCELFYNIKKVLENAIVRIKQISPNIINGEVRSFLSVHRKDNNLTLNNEIIRKTLISGKMTYFTDNQIKY